MEAPRSNRLRRGLDRLYLVSGWLAAVFIALIGLLVVCQVSLNAVDRLSTLLTGSAIGLTIPSYAEITGFFLAAASFLALAHTLRDGGHIRVTLLISQFRPRLERAFEVWCLLVAAATTVYFAWYAFLLVHESFVYHDLSAGMVAIPLWIPQSAMLAGLVVLAISLLDELVRTLRGQEPIYARGGEKLLEGDDEPAGGES